MIHTMMLRTMRMMLRMKRMTLRMKRMTLRMKRKMKKMKPNLNNFLHLLRNLNSAQFQLRLLNWKPMRLLR